MAARVRDGIRRTASLEHRIGRLDARRQGGGQKQQRAFCGITIRHNRRDLDEPISMVLR